MLSFLLPSIAHSTGAFEDLGRFSYFIRAPVVRAADGRLIRADAPGSDAVIYGIAGRFPLRSYLLLELELPFVAVLSGGDVSNGIGDFRTHAKARLWTGDGRSVHLLGSVRFATGKITLFPYSTASLDFGFGAGYADTMSVVTYWAGATVTVPTRVSDELETAKLHGTFGTLSGGIVVRIGARVELQAAAAVHSFESGATRLDYLLSFDYWHSPRIGLGLLAQAEGGERSERAVDVALGAVVRVLFGLDASKGIEGGE